MPNVLNQYLTENAALYHGDCIEIVRALPDDCIDLTLTSIPFSDQYTYSPSDHDPGNNAGDEGFFEHMEWLVPELYRVTVPGRIAAVHRKDRLRYKAKWGTTGLNPFSDDVTRIMQKHGWVLMWRITIATDPVRELHATDRHGLRFMDIKKDASVCSGGIPEYLMIYRKWEGLPGTSSYSQKPVVHVPEGYSLKRWQLEANSVWQSDGKVLYGAYDHEARVEALESGWDILPNGDGASSRVRHFDSKHRGPQILTSIDQHPWVWPDISRMQVLNYKIAKENADEKHICPLQLDLVERAIRLYSNPGDVVLDPFAGIGSVPFKAIEMGRKAVGFELKDSYFKWMCRYVDDAENARSSPTLFDVQEAA